MSVCERAWAKSHAHRLVFHPLFLPHLSSARLFRQARSCTSRVKTVPNAARSSGKTSFQLLPVFPTAATVFNGSIVDQLFFYFFYIFWMVCLNLKHTDKFFLFLQNISGQCFSYNILYCFSLLFINFTFDS